MKRSVLFGNNSPSLPTGPSGPFFLGGGGSFLGQYFWYPKPTELYRIADAVEYGAVFSIRTVAFWAEILASTRVLYFAMFVGIGLLVTPRHFKNAAKYE